MNTKRTHIVIPEHVVIQIDRIVGKRGRSRFLAPAAEKELLRLGLIKALAAAAGSWKDKDPPELKEGAVTWVNELRRHGEERYQKAGTP